MIYLIVIGFRFFSNAKFKLLTAIYESFSLANVYAQLTIPKQQITQSLVLTTFLVALVFITTLRCRYVESSDSFEVIYGHLFKGRT